MEELRSLIGTELSVQQVSRDLYFLARGLEAPVVGALHVTCADESELECIDAFQGGFAQPLLPELKFGQRSAFRLANLGARYEWGAVRIAEEHFATPESMDAFKLLVLKLNSHVAVDESDGEQRFGHFLRYGASSSCCGALHALLAGGQLPCLDDLRELFDSEGRNRVETLLDEAAVDPGYRALLASVVSARLQARRAIIDIQDYQPKSPTLYLVVPCVTLNREGVDTEIVCGVYQADLRGAESQVSYVGLGDDPSEYRVELRHGRLDLKDDQLPATREARDHRQAVLHQWRKQRRTARPVDARLDEFWRDAESRRHQSRHATHLLKAALPLLAEVAPIPAAVCLFAMGGAGVYHVFRAHRLARGLDDSGEARKMLHEMHGKLDTLDHEQARDVLELLHHEYCGS